MTSIVLATTVVVIFAVIATVWLSVIETNSGDLWGFDGSEEPSNLAERMYEQGDYRFLVANLNGSYVHTTKRLLLTMCADHPLDEENRFRLSKIQITDQGEAIEIAQKFERSFNNRMLVLMKYRKGLECNEFLSM